MWKRQRITFLTVANVVALAPLVGTTQTTAQGAERMCPLGIELSSPVVR